MLLNVLCTDPPEVHLNVIGGAGMDERLRNTLIRILVFRILSADGDGDPAGGIFDPFDEALPVAKVGPGACQVQFLQDDLIHFLLGVNERDFVNGLHVAAVHNTLRFHIGKERDLLPDIV